MSDITIAQQPTENSHWLVALKHLLRQADESMACDSPDSLSLQQLNDLWGLVEHSSLPANSAINLYRRTYPSVLLALKLYLQTQYSAQDALHCLQQNTTIISTLLHVEIGTEIRGKVPITITVDNRACLLHRQAIFGYMGDLLNHLGPQPGQLIADASLPLGAMPLLDAEKDTGFNLQPSNKIAFRLVASQLQEPQQHRHAALLTHIGPALKRFKAEELVSQSGLEDEVRQKILQSLPEGNAGLETVAEQIQISTRHLRRKLAEAGTSFEKLFESTRKSQADYLMSNTAMSLTEIAYELGFNDPSSLTRACKRWFDCNPSDYRLRQLVSSYN